MAGYFLNNLSGIARKRKKTIMRAARNIAQIIQPLITSDGSPKPLEELEMLQLKSKYS
jgi:hypothetical protein